MANPLVFYENIFEDGTITSDSEASGFIDDNITDWRVGTAFRWKAGDTTSPTYVAVDLGVGNTANPTTVAIGGHNLFSAGAQWKIQYSNDNFVTDTNDAHSFVVPTDDLPAMKTFTASAQRYWRIYIEAVAGATSDFTVAPQLGVVTLGRRIDFELGALPDLDPYNDMPETDWAVSENGSMLGANLRYIRKIFRINYDAPGFTDTNFFDPTGGGLTWDSGFIPHARSKPFWFAWNITTDASEVYLCRSTAGISMPFIGSTARRGLFCEFEAFREAS